MMRPDQPLLFLLSGEAKQLLATHALPESTIIQPFAEKDLTTPLQTLRRLRQAKGKIFFWHQSAAIAAIPTDYQNIALPCWQNFSDLH